MAKMGKRKLAKAKVLAKPADESFMGISRVHMEIFISPVQIQPIAILGFKPPVLGVPIMREGFITETGLLFGSTEHRTP